MEPTSVHLWRVPLDEPFDESILSADELDRANRYATPNLRDHYCAGRSALRIILASYLHCEPASIAFTYNEHGKPLIEGDLNFNLSNAANRMLLGVTRGRKIGVDLEKRDRRMQSDSIARRFFSPNEVDQLLALPEAQRDAAFLRCWVRKEAYVKALGTGISGGLANFSVSLADKNETPLLLGSEEEWRFYDVDMGERFVASVTVTAAPCLLQTFDFPAGAIRASHVAGGLF